MAHLDRRGWVPAACEDYILGIARETSEAPANRVAALAAAGIAGSLTNTLLVLGVLGLYAYIPWPLVGTIAVTNGLLEAAAAAVITVAVVAAWQGIEYGRRGSRLE